MDLEGGGGGLKSSKGVCFRVKLTAKDAFWGLKMIKQNRLAV
jgi:hypothetical protein